MASFDVLLNNFYYGQIDSQSQGYIEKSVYQNSVRIIKNGYIDNFGNITKRPGTWRISEIDADEVKIIPFKYEENEIYLLVFCINYKDKGNVIIFFKNDSQVLNADGTEYYINHPYVSGELDNLRWVQKNEKLLVFHSSHPIQQIVYNDETNWSISDFDIDFYVLVAYGDGSQTIYEVYLPIFFVEEGKQQLSFTIGGTETTVTDSNGQWSDSNLTTATIDYKSGRVYLKFTNAPDDNKPIKITFLKDLQSYPSVGLFYQNRLVIAGYDKFPTTIMGSSVADFSDFCFGSLDSNAWIFTIDTKYKEKIVWLVDHDYLVIGTSFGEYRMVGGDKGITPTSVHVDKFASYGSAFIDPVSLGRTIFFIYRNERSVYLIERFLRETFIYSAVKECSVYAKQIINDDVKKITFQVYPYKFIYVLLNNGKIVVLKYDENQEGVYAWFLYDLGNVIDISNLDSDDVYLIVNRGDRFILEKMGDYLYNDYFDTVFVDSAVELTDSNGTDLFNVPFNDGDTINVLCDNGVHPSVVVNNGQAQLQWKAKKIVVGYSYDYLIQTHPIEFYLPGQLCTLNYVKKLGLLRIGLDKSIGGYFSVLNEIDWQSINEKDDLLYFRLLSYPMDNLVPLYTGWYKVIGNFSYANRISLLVKNSEPVPFNLLGFSIKLGIEGRE